MSLTYLGYRVKIGNTIISNDLIQKGSYNFVKNKRIPSDWKDAAQIQHQQVLDNRKVTISFSLRERKLTEQDDIKAIFTTQENLTVKYWDDYACEYKEGTFYMDAPTITHRTAAVEGGLLYASTPIKLTEY